MELFKSGNPTLTQKIFDRSSAREATLQGTMSVRGAINKFGFLMLMVIGGAAYSWHLYQADVTGSYSTVLIWMIVGAIGGLITAIVIRNKPEWAPYLSPAYGLLQGLCIGGLSALVNGAFSKNYPGIIMQAVGLTFGVAIAMFILYNFRVIKATEKLKSVIYLSMVGILMFYMLRFVLRLFGVDMPFMYDSSALGIGISLFIIGIAALKLILDFNLIEEGAEQGAPKFMEWYGAFGLLVTLIWLYMEILRLLMRFGNNRN